MRYIFEDGYSMGKIPIKNIQVAWYNMENNGDCFDEDWIEPQDFDVNDLMRICTEDDENEIDKSRVFVNLVDGRSYELILKDVTNNKQLGNFYR